jgi:hypothetical protein
VSLELLTALSSIGTFIVIAATAVAAFWQLRHMSGSNSISTLTEAREVLESPEFAAARRFVSKELPDLLKDPGIRRQLEFDSPLPDQLQPLNIVGNFYEALGSWVRHGVIDQNIVVSLWSSVVVATWHHVTPALAIMRRSAGAALWDQFEYLARISQEWIDCHPDGDYPKGVAHMLVVDEWLEEDQRLTGGNGAVSAQKVFSLQRGE